MHQKFIKQSVFNKIVRYLDTAFPPLYKSRKATNEHILFDVLRVLKYGIPWRDASRNNTVVWQTVYKRFHQWRKYDTFNKLWNRAIRVYANQRVQRDKDWFNQLYIDSTQIKNIGGTNCTGRNPTDRGRLGTKISLICDRNMTVVGSVMAPSNISDISLTEPTINSIPKDVTTRKSRNLSYLVADKGYSSYNLSERLQTNHNIRLVAPVKSKHRPSNKTCTTILGRKLLQKRHVVENTMSNLKRFKRIRTREDGLIKSYDAFFYLGLVIRTLSRL